MNYRMGLLAAACVAVLGACDSRTPEPPRSTTTPAVAEEAGVAAPAAPVPAAASEPAAPPSPAAAQLDEYAEKARELSTAIASRADTSQLQAQTEALLDLAGEISPAYSTRHPHCVEYLEAALAVRDTWSDLDHETIERDYHHDGALPKPDNVGVCYHMKDLIVHPATVLVLLSQPQPDYEQSKREIDEVIAHLGAVRMQL
ncbi:hypothetical protein [Lysobacter sp. D1-1-M9]|uniref:hypothetical protein n=1 Tax=Novilysobacter longmucuonensis TaxID=3098603 RepID=UPI002FCBD49D